MTQPENQSERGGPNWPTRPLPDPLQRLLQQRVEARHEPRLCFSTNTHLYELVYHCTEIGHQRGWLEDEPIYRVEFLSPLRELPFTGASWLTVVEDMAQGRGYGGAYFHVSLSYQATEHLGNFSRVTCVLQRMDIASVLLIRPSHTTPEIARLRAQHGEDWYTHAYVPYLSGEAPPPPEPSTHVQQDAHGAPLFDVFAWGRRGSPVTVGVRWRYEEARSQGERVATQEGGILLRYHEPEDTLEWVRSPLFPPAIQEAV